MTEDEREKKADALADGIVAGYPDASIDDVVDQALESDESQRDRLTTTFNSGIYAGARLAFLSSMRMEDEMVAVLKDTITRCEDAMTATDDADTLMAISAIRNPIALFFQEQDRRFAESLAAGFGVAFNIPAELISGNRPTGEIPREVVIQIGAANSMEHGGLFAAWLYGHNAKLECRCPAHMMGNYMEGRPSMETIKDKAVKDFPIPEVGLYQFGRYLIDFCRQQFANNITHHFDVSSISPKEADKMATDILSKFRKTDGA